MPEKSKVINLPLSVTLTPEGEYFLYMNGRKVERPSGGGGVAIIRLTTFSAKMLQRMIAAGYISNIDITRTNFNSIREQIIDLSNLVAYAILRTGYTVRMGEALKRDPRVTKWCRENPRSPIIVSFGDSDSEQDDGVEKMINIILSRHYDKLEDLNANKKEVLELKLRTLLGCINPHLIEYISDGDYRESRLERVTEELGKEVFDYLQKSVVVDYLSLFIMELASMSETDLIYKAVKTYLRGKINMEHFMRNQRDREKILKTLETYNDTASMNWRILGRNISVADSRTYQFFITNYVSEEGLSVDEVFNKTTPSTEHNGLVDYCEFGDRNENRLGLFYLNSLKEECQKHGILFSSHAKYNQDTSASLITLTVRF